MKMTFAQAQERAREVANGAAHTVEYRETVDADGNKGQSCMIYIDKGRCVFADNWGEVFYKLENPKRTEDQQPGPEILA